MLATTRPVWGDQDQDRIAALLAQGDVAGALPLTLARARRLGDDKAAWEQVLTVAGWASQEPGSASAAIEALEHLVALAPEDRTLRLNLAQRLLWAKRTDAALPHVEWLLARGNERDPVALEVATWVLLGEKRSEEARGALRRWIEAAPEDARPRWILADLTHWSARWRDARDQYRAIARLEPASEKLKERKEALRHDHPADVRGELVAWSDNFHNSFTGSAIAATSPLPARMVLSARAEVGVWRQRLEVAPSSAGAPNEVTTDQVTTYGAQGRLRFEAWNSVWPELWLGAEADGAGNRTPIAGAGAQLSIGGRLFGRVYLEHDRHRVSLQAARENLTATGPGWILYAEVTRWLFLSSELALAWINDGNLRTRGVLIAGVHNTGALQLEPRVFAQYDRYRDAYPDAKPYFTPTEPWTYGADLVLRYSLARALVAEAQIGVIKQGSLVAARPGALLKAELARHVLLSLSVGYVGSPEYHQTRVGASMGWLF